MTTNQVFFNFPIMEINFLPLVVSVHGATNEKLLINRLGFKGKTFLRM